MKSLRKLFNKINIRGEILFEEPLTLHSTFRIGGNADIYVKPQDEKSVRLIKEIADENSIPVYPIGGGANILFQDKGYRGIILDTSDLKGISFDNELVYAEAGVEMSGLAEFTAGKSLKGLETFYGMPGCAGGSIFMNARCYGTSVSDRIIKVTYLDSSNSISTYSFSKKDFGYKVSPFMDKNVIILSAVFSLEEDEAPLLLKRMLSYRKEREEKGHYLFPCAGSVFKNNRDFGEPTGKIIDRLGLRGFKIGGAMISEKHANIIVNTGGATEKDVKNLIDLIEDKVFESFGFRLEREIIYVDEGGR